MIDRFGHLYEELARQKGILRSGSDPHTRLQST
jgi:hypothetical protein